MDTVEINVVVGSPDPTKDVSLTPEKVRSQTRNDREYI
jgi:hypothetical protein